MYLLGNYLEIFHTVNISVQVLADAIHVVCIELSIIWSMLIHTAIECYVLQLQFGFCHRFANKYHLNHHIGVDTGVVIDEAFGHILHATKHDLRFSLELTFSKP